MKQKNKKPKKEKKKIQNILQKQTTMGFEPMILFNILVQQTNALNRSATYFLKI